MFWHKCAEDWNDIGTSGNTIGHKRYVLLSSSVNVGFWSLAVESELRVSADWSTVNGGAWESRNVRVNEYMKASEEMKRWNLVNERPLEILWVSM